MQTHTEQHVVCIKLLSCLTLTSAIRISNSTLRQKHFSNHFHFMKSLMTTKKG